MKTNFLLIVFTIFFVPSFAQDLKTVFESSDSTETATYQETIEYYELLASSNNLVSLMKVGETDSGLPLHLVIISKEKQHSINQLSESDKACILVMNAIHAGEPDGVDASMLLTRELMLGNIDNKILDSVNLAIIPVFNIGGSLQRNSYSRANQNGPKEYGFRGNAKNLDLNRDFIKLDSKNTRSFSRLLTTIDPDIFIDTHVTNGADYPYVLTMIETHPSKLMPAMRTFQQEEFSPFLYAFMEENGSPTTPFVNIYRKVPDHGWPAFFDSPRYSTGLAAIHFTYSFVTESHMFKPYNLRVKATYNFLVGSMQFAFQNRNELISSIESAREEYNSENEATISWEFDSTQFKEIDFNAYAHEYRQSEVTGLQQLYYNRSEIKKMQVPYYNHYRSSVKVTKPKYYLISQAWSEVIEKLEANGIEMIKLPADTSIEVTAYYIDQFETYSRAYEGHYPHYNTSVRSDKTSIKFYRGDYIIPLDQKGQRYLLEVLEPEANDSFFNWNFFDTVLSRKEYFSSYVFDTKAKEYLENDPQLKADFERKRSEDQEFAKSTYAQLDFIYKRSPHYEKQHLRYPVYRIP